MGIIYVPGSFAVQYGDRTVWGSFADSYSPLYWVAYGQTQSRSAFCLFVFFFFFFLVFFFSVSVKVLPVTPLVSGVFVHRAFCAYFLRIERVVELRRFLWWTQ